MDPPPALHPIVLSKPISSRPFEYTPEGLTFKGYKRESVAVLKDKLAPPKRKNSKPLKKAKDWWLAQLRLYGIEAKSSTTVPELTKMLTKAVKKMKEPTEAILALEKKLERKYLAGNEEARNKEYPTLSDEQKASKYSHRFLSEKFFNEGEDEKLLAVEIGGGEGRRLGEVPAAAARLGLHIEDAIGPQKRRWIIVGKDKAVVVDRKCAMEKEWQDRDSIVQQEAEERAAKRRKVEKDRQKCESSASFKDVEGKWRIDCPKMDHEYQKARRKMSIFFFKPHKRNYHSDESESEEDDEDEDVETSALVLSANFEMGILEGVLRSSGELPPDSTCFPIPKLPFTWRGRETGEGEIQLDYEGDTNLGSFEFLSKTTLKGILKSSYGKFPFTGSKVADVAVHKDDVWDELSERAHERERVGRW